MKEYKTRYFKTNFFTPQIKPILFKSYLKNKMRYLFIFWESNQKKR